MSSRANMLAHQPEATRGRTRSSTGRSTGVATTTNSRKIKYVPPSPLWVEEEVTERSTSSKHTKEKSPTKRRTSKTEISNPKLPVVSKKATTTTTKDIKIRRPRRDLDPTAIERAAKKELEKKKITSNPPESPRRKLKATAQIHPPPKQERARRGSSRSRSPHKAYVLGDYDTDSDDDSNDVDDDDEDSFAGDDDDDDDDDDDILGITIDDDGDLEKYMDPEARANLRRRRKDEDSDDSDDNDDDNDNEQEERRQGTIFRRFRSTSPSRRRIIPTSSTAPIVSPAGNTLARIAKSLSPGTRSRHKVRAKQTDGNSAPRRAMRRGSGTLHNDETHQSAGSQMVRRLSGSFETIKLALDGLGSQHGIRSTHQPRRRTRQLDDEEEIENFDWDENRHLSKEEIAYFERMYNEIEQLDL